MLTKSMMPTIGRRTLLTGLAATSLLPRSGSAADAPLATTDTGQLRGVAEADGVLAFKGIPYARPPVGQLRFRAPQAVEAWTGIRDANAYGAIAIQPKEGAAAVLPQSEDCLFLNVWTQAADGGRRPVLFYIHGGAFVSGTGGTSMLAGHNLAARYGVVVVTINYRLGLLGFPPFRVEGESNNLGLLDQIAALRWVRRNIGAFGGDPDNVTLCGLSAGGWSIASLLVAKQARGLFHKAVPQSSCSMIAAGAEQQKHYASLALQAVGLQSPDPARLASLPLETLVQAQAAVQKSWDGSQRASDAGDDSRPFITNIDGVVLPDSPIRLIERGACADVPVLIGTTSEEIFPAPFRMAAIGDWYKKSSVDRLLALLPDRKRTARIWPGYKAARPEASDEVIAGAIRSDLSYRVPSIRVAEARAAAGRPAWMYQFDLRAASPAIGIATHATDMMLWLGNLGAEPFTSFFFGRKPTQEELALQARMTDDLVQFMRTGAVSWPRYDRQRRPVMVYDVMPKVQDDPRGSERALWDGVIA